MNAEVVCVASRVPTEPYYRFDAFLASLRRFAEAPAILGLNEEWKGLMTKPWRLRNWLREGKNASDRLIVCDAYDIIFTKHPHGIGDRCAEWWGDAIVFNGEKGCWPREDLKESFPDDGSPWRFLNSGFMCGPADKILALLEVMPIETIGFDPPGGPYPNDQGEYQELFAKQAEHGIKMVVDTQCKIAQTLSACEVEEFHFIADRIVNKTTHTEPGVFHCNGGAKNNFLPLLQQALNL